ncbi:class I SAM-dependent methyltransferase [Sinorhizobium numidicum]|uniref:Class I SAM-dependent methyltransferase n=1 Tax=Sinorhizobium numidicum TaxID=680248 RepID=A0ABY8D143_9HYPH|nr:methyltransferase domain-containing protein [Sinorhizobium numidicum]WEX76212.1 class I SAM-dependent methyltransferase [Sinorhizobium numidicum]WEX82871.1 class I SAM-dependent methyltransferase [Sinorhizobium numidicum]
MAEKDKLFAGAIPEIYERLLVPLIFEGFARDLAERVARLNPLDVLEIAAGTGVVTRALAPLLDPEAQFVVTDLNQPMLDIAAAKQGGEERIVWQQADALALPFDDESFDVVLCQFGVMFFPDRVKGYREAHRVLKPGGHFLINVWDRIEANEVPETVAEVLEARFPENPPRFIRRVPHGYADPETIRADLEAAGFSDITLETLEKKTGPASASDAATAFCQGTPIRNEIEERDASALAAVTEAAAEALTRRFGSGMIEERIRAHVVSAVR